MRLSLSLSGLALVTLMAGPPTSALAQSAQPTLAGANAHAREMQRLFPDGNQSSQATPRLIPKFKTDQDPSGAVATMQPNGPTLTAKNAFSQISGLTGAPASPVISRKTGGPSARDHVHDRFHADANEALFGLVDGATCPSDDVSTPHAKRKAYSLLLDKGLIRIGLPMPATAQFQILNVSDPYGCNTNPVTGLTSSTARTVTVYRRPLPATNLGFLEHDHVGWARARPVQPSGRCDADPCPSRRQPQARPRNGRSWPSKVARGPIPLRCAKIFPQVPGSSPHRSSTIKPSTWPLTARMAAGNSFSTLANFFIGINDPLGSNPTGAPFTPDVFGLYDAWSSLGGDSPKAAAREAIARGEQVFNTTKINITGVAGLNDVLKQPSIAGFCGTCHDTPFAGDHSVKAPLNIGIANASATALPPWTSPGCRSSPSGARRDRWPDRFSRSPTPGAP